MTDTLLPYYNRELSYLRRLGAEFAEAHPKIAGRLRLGPDASEDPHVERLIQGVAYLNARVRHKLDDDFPEITDALLGVLYPHYQAPIPSMTVVQFELDPGQDELTTGHTIPRGAALDTEPIQGEPCRFRTAYPVTLWPLEVRSASLAKPPFTAPAAPHVPPAAAVLRLVLGCRAPSATFAALPLESLRFYLKGQAQHVFALYELIFNHTLAVAAAGSPDDPAPVWLDPDCLRPVGFERDEGMLPYPPRSFVGYRLLTEFFAFPEKFLFIDLAGLSPRVLGGVGNQLEVFLYLNRFSPDLERNLSADTFRLGCTPVVNLYKQRAEPIPLTHTESEYRVVPDARRPLAHEVYSIDRVTGVPAEGESVAYLPFFSVKHAVASRDRERFWHASRRTAGETPGEAGTEVFVSLVDLQFQPSAPADWALDVESTCLNRDLPHRLPFGGDQPHLQLSEGDGLVGRVTCLMAPTRTLRPALKQGALWRFISHLSLNHLSLVDGAEGAHALREILKLYDFADSDETRSLIDGVLDVRSRRVASRVGRGGEAVCRGVEVTVHLDEQRFTGSGLYLFACVLERFLALYCTVNAFSKLVVTVEGRKGELRRWSPRMGEQVLA
jgi:type VI secretion system protein ImpG